MINTHHLLVYLHLGYICTHLHLTYVLQGLIVKEMEELRDDIKMHLDLDKATPTQSTGRYYSFHIVIR